MTEKAKNEQATDTEAQTSQVETGKGPEAPQVQAEQTEQPQQASGTAEVRAGQLQVGDVPPAQVHAPAQDVTPVDPSQPVGNWGVYPPLDENVGKEAGIVPADDPVSETK